MKLPVIAISLLVLAGCAATQEKAAPAPSLPDSVHWYRDSAEQRAIYVETYRAAAASVRSLSKGLTARSWAVILDVDETVLDNSDYQKRQALAGQGFDPKTWEAWINERHATALPGAKEFIDSVTDQLHGHVIFVTNRLQSQCAATEDNLRAQGIRYDRILCDAVGDGNKNPRFRAVAEGGAGEAQSVLLWVGDNIQDFPGLSQANASAESSQFGVRYFVLPNPMYGSWMKNPPR